MIKNMVTVNFIGQMEDLTEDIGLKVNNMEEGFIVEAITKKERVNGLMGKK
jgi:hypothetical protein